MPSGSSFIKLFTCYGPFFITVHKPDIRVDQTKLIFLNTQKVPQYSDKPRVNASHVNANSRFFTIACFISTTSRGMKIGNAKDRAQKKNPDQIHTMNIHCTRCGLHIMSTFDACVCNRYNMVLLHYDLELHISCFPTLCT